MEINAILTILGIGAPAGLLTILALFEVSKIKINPISALLRWIGRHLNAEVIEQQHSQGERIAQLSHKLDSQRRRSDDIEFRNVRYRILRFADEIMQGIVLHSEEHYDQILEDIDQYEAYCDAHKDFKNGKGKAAMALIRSNYARRLEKNDFLRGDSE